MSRSQDVYGQLDVREPSPMSKRFRGFLPVVVDVETGGFNAATDALLEIAAVLIEIQGDGSLERGETFSYHVQAFEGANIEPAALEVNGIHLVIAIATQRLRKSGCLIAIIIMRQNIGQARLSVQVKNFMQCWTSQVSIDQQRT